MSECCEQNAPLFCLSELCACIPDGGCCCQIPRSRWRCCYGVGITYRIRKAPSLQAEEVGLLKYGEEFDVYEQSDGWVQHARGWSIIYSDDKQGLQSMSRWRCCCGIGITHRIRKAPSLQAENVGLLDHGEEFDVYEQSDGWVQHARGWSIIYTNNKRSLKTIH